MGVAGFLRCGCIHSAAWHRSGYSERQRRYGTEMTVGNGKTLATRRVIMLLDDDPGMRVSLRFLLEICGYTVADYADPAPLLHDLGAMAPACAIIDAHLSGADGVAVGRAALDLRPDLRIVLITGHVDRRILAAAAELGKAAVLEKPFSEAALLEAIGIGGAVAPEIPYTA